MAVGVAMIGLSELAFPVGALHLPIPPHRVRTYLAISAAKMSATLDSRSDAIRPRAVANRS